MKSTIFEVVENGLNFASHTSFEALAEADSDEFFKPIESGIVDGFGDVEASIEAGVVSSAEYHHDLAGFVFHLA
jgi:hypothetical protein